MRRFDEAELANPWWTIWFRPRRTVRWIVDGQVPPNWMPVLVLGAVGVLLNVVNAWLAIPAAPRVALARWSLISLLTMLFWVLCGPFVLALYGRRRGGVGNSRQLRHALAWSYAPIAVSTLPWIPLWIITDGAASQSSSPSTGHFGSSRSCCFSPFRLPTFGAWLSPSLPSQKSSDSRYGVRSTVCFYCSSSPSSHRYRSSW